MKAKQSGLFKNDEDIVSCHLALNFGPISLIGGTILGYLNDLVNVTDLADYCWGEASSSKKTVNSVFFNNC